jgi:hypothetical protein
MYFFELMGVKLDDEASMKILIDFVLAKNSITGNTKGLKAE